MYNAKYLLYKLEFSNYLNLFDQNFLIKIIELQFQFFNKIRFCLLVFHLQECLITLFLFFDILPYIHSIILKYLFFLCLPRNYFIKTNLINILLRFALLFFQVLKAFYKIFIKLCFIDFIEFIPYYSSEFVFNLFQLNFPQNLNSL